LGILLGVSFPSLCSVSKQAAVTAKAKFGFLHRCRADAEQLTAKRLTADGRVAAKNAFATDFCLIVVKQAIPKLVDRHDEVPCEAAA